MRSARGLVRWSSPACKSNKWLMRNNKSTLPCLIFIGTSLVPRPGDKAISELTSVESRIARLSKGESGELPIYQSIEFIYESLVHDTTSLIRLIWRVLASITYWQKLKWGWGKNYTGENKIWGGEGMYGNTRKINRVERVCTDIKWK